MLHTFPLAAIPPRYPPNVGSIPGILVPLGRAALYTLGSSDRVPSSATATSSTPTSVRSATRTTVAGGVREAAEMAVNPIHPCLVHLYLSVTAW